MEFISFFASLTFSLQSVCRRNLWGEWAFTEGGTEIFKALTLGLLEMIVKRSRFLETEAKILTLQQLKEKSDES